MLASICVQLQNTLDADVLVYSTSARTHCFSIIPESADTKRQLPKARTGAAGWGARDKLRIDDPDNYLDPEQPVWIDAFGRELARHIGRVDIHAAAGAAVIFNNSSYHAGTVRHTTQRRRTHLAIDSIHLA